MLPQLFTPTLLRAWAPLAFWADPASAANLQAQRWEAERPADSALMARMAAVPTATWLNGSAHQSHTLAARVRAAAERSAAVPVFVIYAIPNRDCGGESAGGEASANYREFVSEVAGALQGSPALVILEPDAIAGLGCLSPAGKQERLALLRGATETLTQNPLLRVYLDAGHPRWLPAAEVADSLKQAGVELARGVSLNVSNFVPTAENVRYGETLAARLPGLRYVVDTSRNGAGTARDWCNPAGQSLGVVPTTETGTPHGDAFLWVKRPGESDGACNGGPNAGAWWPDYALGLARAAWGA